MKKIQEVYITNRDDWRTWLEQNHSTSDGVWLIYYKTSSGSPSIPYGDSIEEALCFGWVDSIIKKLDDDRFARKFTHRKGRSRWFKSNKRRSEKMIGEGKMTAIGLAIIREAKASGEWSRVPMRRKRLVVPGFFEEALARNQKALENFKNFAPTYKRQFVMWMSSAKREQTRMKHLAEVLRYLEHNKKLPLK